jgi:hypothetical protein
MAYFDHSQPPSANPSVLAPIKSIIENCDEILNSSPSDVMDIVREIKDSAESLANDTQRLDWLLGHPGVEMDVNRMRLGVPVRWHVKWFAEGKQYIAYGRTQRDCIDSVLAGQIETWS